MPLLCWMFEPTYTALDIYNIHRKKKKSSNISQQNKISCNHFFFSPIFFQLIFLRPLSRLRNFLISFTIHKIRSLLASLHSLHSLTTQTKKKTKKMLKMPPSPPHHEKSRQFKHISCQDFSTKKYYKFNHHHHHKKIHAFIKLFSTFLTKIIF